MNRRLLLLVALFALSCATSDKNGVVFPEGNPCSGHPPKFSSKAPIVCIDNHYVVSHRVVKVFEGGDRPVFQTKGDANDAPDPWNDTPAFVMATCRPVGYNRPP